MSSKSEIRKRLFDREFINLSRTFIFVCGILSVFVPVQTAFAQGSEIESNIYKNNSTKSSSTKKAKNNPPKRATTRNSNAAKAQRNNSRKPARRSRSDISLIFSTPEPNQEIWRGNEILGTSDENAKFEIALPQGNYLVSVKNEAGDLIVSSMLVSVTPKNKEIKLVRNVDPAGPLQLTAEETLKEQQLQEALDAAEKINDIMKRYGDPLKTNTVSLADWEYVYQMAQANQLKDFTAIQIEAQRWFSSGQIEMAKGNYANAFKAFNQAAEFMPESAYPYYALGEAYLANKQPIDAFNAYQKAVQIDPKFALAQRKLGDLHLTANRPKEAGTAYETALANGFDTPAVHFDLAKAHLKNKRWDDASKELELVVREAPSGDVYVTLGDLYLELKRNISAYESYKKATELSPDSAHAFYKLGEILYNEREYEKAKTAFEQALVLDEQGTEINLNQTKKLVRESAQKMK
jgi:tetratricopeptide (TPR) repeat protein